DAPGLRPAGAGTCAARRPHPRAARAAAAPRRRPQRRGPREGGDRADRARHRGEPDMRPEVADLARFQAVLFDLDGVLTDTARVHTAAWKETFDDFLRERAIDTGQPFVPFDPDADYKRYVDGMPRYDGVRRFLSSRGIELPEGEPSDP